MEQNAAHQHLNAGSKRAPGRFPPWLFAFVSIFGSAVITVIFFEAMFLSDIPPLLQGKWVITEGELEGAILEFFKDGTMKGSARVGGEVRSLQWNVTMNGDDRFRITVGEETRGLISVEEQTILELSSRYFKFQDSQGKVTKLTRWH
jgi:hypothetical protein